MSAASARLIGRNGPRSDDVPVSIDAFWFREVRRGRFDTAHVPVGNIGSGALQKADGRRTRDALNEEYFRLKILTCRLPNCKIDPLENPKSRFPNRSSKHLLFPGPNGVKWGHVLRKGSGPRANVSGSEKGILFSCGILLQCVARPGKRLWSSRERERLGGQIPYPLSSVANGSRHAGHVAPAARRGLGRYLP